MSIQKDKITVNQLAFFTIQTAIGEGALTLPYGVHSAASSDGWISTIIVGIMSQISIIVIWQVCRRFPGLTLMEFLPQLLGKFAGRLLGCIYIVYFIGIASLVVVNYCRIINSWIFPETPKSVIMILMMITAYSLANERLRVIARFCVVISIMLLFLIGLVAIPLWEGNFLYLLPVGQADFGKLAAGVREATIAMAGFELLYMVYPYVDGTAKQIRKAMLNSYLFVTAFYLMIVIASFIFFSPDELHLIPEPMLYMLKAFTFRIVERTDLLFLSLWVVIVLTSIVSYVYLAAAGIKKMMNQERNSKTTLAVVILCSLLSLIPNHFLLIASINKYYSYLTLVMNYAVPVFLLIVCMFRTRGKAA
ncbi:UNVERIFIED_CONTAM: spore germination protein (amino acid permease) [Brevibacillus sp. OAP136]